MTQDELSTAGTTATRAGQDAPECRREQELRHIGEALRGLSFGSVTILVQDGVVVQIDRTEKRRLHRSSSPPQSVCALPSVATP
jgi:hypothetical protein